MAGATSAAIQRTLDPAVARGAANENARRVLTVKQRKDLERIPFSLDHNHTS